VVAIVYADRGYPDAAEKQRKSQLAAEIARAIKAHRLTQAGVRASTDHGSRAIDEQGAQVGVAPFGDPKLLRLSTRASRSTRA
jgi:Helix-turn-helix domain